MSTLIRLKNFVEQKAPWLLGFLILIYVTVFFLIGLWKYSHHLYNGLDLAIFNQIFFNTIHGQWFYSSIQDGSYLGDHFSPIIIFLLPFYFIYQQPQALLFIQTIILGLGAIPLFLITKKILQKNTLALLVSLLYLLNFSLHGINVFEFELLPIAIPLLFAVYYFYHEKKFGWFLFFAVLSLLVREDVALIIFMFGVLAWLDREAPGERKWQWILTPMIISTVWFLNALQIIHYFNPAGYKFLLYYQWLWSAPGQILPHLFSLGNLELIIGLGLPFLFLILLAPRYLILTIPIFLQTILTAQGGGNVVLQTHYVSLFLPPLFISLIFALKKINESPKLLLLKNNFGFLIVLLIIGNLYLALALGPLGYFFKKDASLDLNKIALENYFAEKIPNDTSILATDRFLPLLSSRSEIYSLNYAFLDQKQFSDEKYLLPEDLKYLLIDFDALADYQLQYQHHIFYGKYYPDGFNNLREIIRNFDLKETQNGVALFERKKTPGEAGSLIDERIETILTAASQQNLRGGLELTSIGSLKRVID